MALTSGVTYWKLQHGYPGDITLNCGLKGSDLDSNFYFLRGRDIDKIEMSEGNLVISLLNGTKLAIERFDSHIKDLVQDEIEGLELNIDLSGSSYNTETGVLTIVVNGKPYDIGGFIKQGEIGIYVGNGLTGDGTQENPIQINDELISNIQGIEQNRRAIDELNRAVQEEAVARQDAILYISGKTYNAILEEENKRITNETILLEIVDSATARTIAEINDLSGRVSASIVGIQQDYNQKINSVSSITKSNFEIERNERIAKDNELANKISALSASTASGIKSNTDKIDELSASTKENIDRLDDELSTERSERIISNNELSSKIDNRFSSLDEELRSEIQRAVQTDDALSQEIYTLATAIDSNIEILQRKINNNNTAVTNEIRQEAIARTIADESISGVVKKIITSLGFSVDDGKLDPNGCVPSWNYEKQLSNLKYFKGYNFSNVLDLIYLLHKELCRQETMVIGKNAITASTTENGNRLIELVIGDGNKILYQDEEGLKTALSIEYDEENSQIQLKGNDGKIISSFDASVFTKQSFLKDVKVEGEGENKQIVFIFVTADGTETQISLPVSQLLITYKGVSGITIDNDYNVGIKLDEEGDKYLVITNNGLRISGLTKTINEINSSIQDIYQKLSEKDDGLITEDIVFTGKSGEIITIYSGTSVTSAITIVAENAGGGNANIEDDPSLEKLIVTTADGSQYLVEREKLEAPAKPTFSQPQGVYTGSVSVTISTVTSGAVIRYTSGNTEPADPTPQTGAQGKTVTFSQNNNNALTNYYLKAIAVKNGLSSPVTEIQYQVRSRVPDVKLTSSGTEYSESRTVFMSCQLNGAQIKYTLDGSNPKTNGVIYNGSIVISNAGTTTIKAIALYTDWADSNIITQSIVVRKLAQPSISITGSNISNPRFVSFTKASTSPEEAQIHYTLNGTTPTASSPVYDGIPIELTASTTAKAIAVCAGWITSTVTASTITVGHLTMYYGYAGEEITASEITELPYWKEGGDPEGEDYTATTQVNAWLWICIDPYYSFDNEVGVTSSGFAVPFMAPQRIGNYDCYRSDDFHKVEQMPIKFSITTN